MSDSPPSVVYGVHLGNTSASLAISRDGRTEVIANDSGDRVTPSVVAFTDREILVGAAARQQLLRNAANTVPGVKSLLGIKYSKSIAPEGPLQTIDRSGKPAFDVEYKGKRQIFTPVEVASSILKDLLKLGQSNTGSPAKDVVLTTPCDSTPEFERDLVAAARAAGFNVLRLVKEPVAAVMAYGLGQETRSFDPLNVLVCRVGGTSTEASFLSVQNGLIRVLNSKRAQSVNGNKLTDVAAKLLAADFQRKTRLDPFENKRSKAKMWNAAEVSKNVLSTLNSAKCSIESLCDGVDLNSSVTRARYESLIGTYIQECVALLRDVIGESSSSSTAVHKIILCGAVGRTPALQTAVRNAFPKSQMLESIAQDEVLAYGCAVQAALMTPAEGGKQHPLTTEEDCNFLCLGSSIYVRPKGAPESTQLLFSQNSPVGFSRNSVSFDSPADQQSFSLEIMEEDLDVNDAVCNVDDVQLQIADVSIKDGESASDGPASKSSTPLRQLPKSLVVVAVVTLKGISAEEAEVVVNGQLRKDGGLVIAVSEKRSNKTETLIIEADSS